MFGGGVRMSEIRIGGHVRESGQAPTLKENDLQDFPTLLSWLQADSQSFQKGLDALLAFGKGKEREIEQGIQVLVDYLRTLYQNLHT